MSPRSLFLSPLILVLATGSMSPAVGQGLTPERHLQMARVGGPVPSPAGAHAAYVLTEFNPETRARHANIWLLDLADGSSRQVTRGQSAYDPQWAPDGTSLYFVRGGEVWRLPLCGGESEQVTHLPLKVSAYCLNPDPSTPPQWGMALLVRLHPDCPPIDWDCTVRAMERVDKRPGLVSELFPLRHWSSWRDSLAGCILIGNPEEERWTALTVGTAPREAFALAGGAEFAFSPGGRSMSFIRNPDDDVATSTNNDIYIMDLEKALGPARANPWQATRQVSRGLGNDDRPVWSPDGRWLAYTTMRRAGYESDQRDIVLYNVETRTERCLTEALDRSPGELAWSHDARQLYFTAYDREATSLYCTEIATGNITRFMRAGSLGALAPLPNGRLALKLGSSRLPHEIFICKPGALAGKAARWMEPLALASDGSFGSPDGVINLDAPLVQLTFHNWERLQYLEMPPVEHFWFTGARGDSVHGFIVPPPGHDGRARVPLVLVMHGGPQWAYHDFWLRSYNFQMIAAKGYAVATINFHGSSGYGAAFKEAIRGHWGDVPGEDVARGMDYILEHFGYVDAARIGAIGRSYGGYLANWLNGHSTHFRCFVAHSGSFDKVASWGTTEELWFPEWEFYGAPWDSPEIYAANSPSEAATKMRTPTLFIHGQRDYRVDLSSSLAGYAALRRQGVPARFLTFPDEGHHIHDPDAWLQMWGEIFGWLGRHL